MFCANASRLLESSFWFPNLAAIHREDSIPDALAPVIVVNGSLELSSLKTYTLLHEISHLGRGSVSLHHRRDIREERWCEAVAADFLLPTAELTKYVKTYRKKTYFGPDDTDDVRLISNRFKASWHSVAIRLQELGLADDSLVKEVAAGGEQESRGFSPEPRTRPIRRVSEFGLTFPRLLLDAVANEQLSTLDARRYLRLQNGDELSRLGAILREGA